MSGRALRAGVMVLALLASEGQISLAIEAPQTPRPGAFPSPSPSTSPTPFTGAVLPQGSEIVLFLTNEVSSAGVRDGSTFAIQLKSPIVVNGVTVADAGTQTMLRVVKVHHSGAGEIDANMQIAVDPIPLKTGGSLPVRLPKELLAVTHSAGEQSTADLADMATAMIFPAALLIHAFQKGREVKLPAGTPIRAYTMAAVDGRDKSAIVIATPRPLIRNIDDVHAEYSPAPFVVPQSPLPGQGRGHGRREPPPSPSPTATPNPAAVTPSPLPSATAAAKP